ncbi:Sister chromatid cohesion protein pds5 [Malassezia sp. CBS 17886]|nr:Sister chromatid cohesion protein pds5 [Malassezia sp. CBS 17886]
MPPQARPSERQLRFRGRLSSSGATPEVLQKRLKELRKELADTEQGAIDTALLDGYCRELVKPALMRHRDPGIRARIACIMADMLRLYAPNAPFSTHEIESIFRFFLDQLTESPGLTDPADADYADKVYLLESLSTVKSVVLVCDLAHAEELITAFFERFWTLGQHPLAKNCELCMTDVLNQLVEESVTLPAEAVQVLLRAFESDAPAHPPPAHLIAIDVCRAAQDHLQKHVAQYFAEEMLAAHRSGDAEETLAHLAVLHAQALRIARAVPSLLTSVVPQLEVELTADDADVRRLAIGVLGRLFALPASDAGSFAGMFPSAWRSWLGRAIDKQAALRVDWVHRARDVLAEHTSLCAALAAPLRAKLTDPDERVRVAAVDAVRALPHELLVQHMPAGVLRELALRGRDRRAAVRDAALDAVGALYSAVYGALVHGDRAACERFAWVPGAVLKCSLAGTPDVVHTVARIFDTYLVPYTGDMDDYVDRLLRVASGDDDDARAALLHLTNLRVPRPSVYDMYLEHCASGDDTVDADFLSVVDACARAVGSASARDDLVAFSAWDEKSAALDAMRTCFDAAVSMQALTDARAAFHDAVHSARPSLVRTMDVLLRLGTYPVVNASVLVPLLACAVGEGWEGGEGISLGGGHDGDPEGVFSARKTAAAALLSYVAQEAPQLWAEHAAYLFDRVAAATDVPTLQACAALACVAESPLCFSAETQAHLADVAVRGDLDTAQYAAASLCAYPAALASLVPALQERLAGGSDMERAAALAAFAEAWKYAPDAEGADAAVNALLERTLMARWPEPSERDTDDDWVDERATPPALRVRLLALKALASWSLGRARDAAVVRPIVKLLWVVVASGEAHTELGAPAWARSRMRLQAAECIAQLAEHSVLRTHIVPKMARLAFALQDECFQVRRDLLHCLLVRLTSQALPPSFHAAIYMVAYDPEDELRARVAAYTQKMAAAMPPDVYQTHFVLVFARFLHLLAQHPDLNLDSAEDVALFARYVDFFLTCVSHADSIGPLAHIARMLKRVANAHDPAADRRLYAMGDLASLVVARFADSHGWALDAPHDAPELPTDLFRPLSPADAEHSDGT